MSSLHYMSPKLSGVSYYGKADALGEQMMNLRTRAVLRSDFGAVIGALEACDGACGHDPCPGRGFHGWYDPDGDGVKPEAGQCETGDSQ